MACVVHLLKKKNMDMALLYLLSTLLIDNQLSTILRVSVYFEQLSVSIRNQGLISRKLDSFGPYFINALVILKQSNIIEISDGRLQLTNSSFPRRLFEIEEAGAHYKKLGTPIKYMFWIINQRIV